jgi:uncharacterized membrane protein YfcA
MPLGDAIAICLLSFGAAFVGTISGFGFALLIVPPLAFFVGAKEAVVLSNVLGSSWLMTMFVRLRRDVVWRAAIPLAIAAFAGMPFGLLVLEVVSERTLQAILGVNVLVATILLWRGARLNVHGRWLDGAAGFISGVLNTSTSMNGPPIVLHLQNQGLAPTPFRATIAAFFVSSALFTLALYAVSGRIGGYELQAFSLGLPGLGAGYVCGSLVVKRLDAAQFRRVVIGVLVLSAMMVMARAGVS